MKRKRISAEQALQTVAIRDGTTVEEVRKEIKLAMLAGLCNTDPAVQTKWKEIPCAGDVPTPEELITYVAEKVTGLYEQQSP